MCLTLNPKPLSLFSLGSVCFPCVASYFSRVVLVFVLGVHLSLSLYIYIYICVMFIYLCVLYAILQSFHSPLKGDPRRGIRPTNHLKNKFSLLGHFQSPFSGTPFCLSFSLFVRARTYVINSNNHHRNK